MGAEGGGSAWGHSSAHNEAILSRRRGLPHPIPDTPSLAAPPLILELWAQTSDLTGGSNPGSRVGVNGSFVCKAG